MTTAAATTTLTTAPGSDAREAEIEQILAELGKLVPLGIVQYAMEQSLRATRGNRPKLARFIRASEELQSASQWFDQDGGCWRTQALGGLVYVAPPPKEEEKR